jgi:radical SAM/Cys-rich protein
MPDFAGTIARHRLDLSPVSVETMQVNVTRLCNQACRHCHVDASPRRREMMSDEVLERCLALLEANEEIRVLDVTGGAPELHPRFRDLVRGARAAGKRVMVRHNLTVTLDRHPLTGESMSDLPEFFAGQEIEVVSSLPYYRSYLTDRQRGRGAFEKSIVSMRRLNALGYGVNGRVLNLVYNPVGPYLPPDQASLELEYKERLQSEHGVRFNSLYIITNMPIHRFRDDLLRHDQYEAYMEKLVNAFNPAAAGGVMCRSMLSVGYDGTVYDCDFNQLLGMACRREGRLLTVFDFSPEEFLQRKILFAGHCFGCTAGAGSSCGGATA